MPRKKSEVTKGSGNVFKDLDYNNPEEALIKARLASEINDIIEERRLTQAKAAKLLGIDQPKVSALSRGRLSGFSVERLLNFLITLNKDIDIVIKPRKKRAAGRGSIHIRHDTCRYA